MVVRFLALQKMVEEKKAEAEKMNMKVAQDPAALDLVHQVGCNGILSRSEEMEIRTGVTGALRTH